VLVSPDGSKLRFRQLFYGLDHDELAHGAAIHELDASRDLREQGVVFAAADVQPRLHPRTPLPHDDGPAGHNLSSKSLKSQTLRVRVAPVP
jgi:hypothetical protein